MRLVSLRIYKKINNEEIRFVKFNETGLSLICDDENDSNSEKHSSSLGKTTFIKCIDVCLGANSIDQIYSDKSTGINIELESYIKSNQISLQLIVRNNQGKKYMLERCLYTNKQFIDGIEYTKIKEYNEKLKKIFFSNSPQELSFRTLITKFIRIKNEDIFRFLNDFKKNVDYYYVYAYFLNFTVDLNETKLIDEKKEIENKLKVINKKYAVNTISDLETIQRQKNESVIEKKNRIFKNDYISEYKNNDSEHVRLIYELDNLTDELYALEFRVKLLEKNVAKEEKKIFKIDENVLNQLYTDASEIVNDQIKSFKEFVDFHNEMCGFRKKHYLEEITILNQKILNLKRQVDNFRITFNGTFIEYKVSVNDKSNLLYDDYYISKKEFEEINYDLDNYKEATNRLKIINDKLTIINDNKINNEIYKQDFAKLFKEKSKKYIGNSFELKFRNNPNQFPIYSDTINGALGTGDTKALICAFDFSFYEYFLKKGLNLPLFVIHDRMENVPLNVLQKIFTDVRTIGVQYVLPILHDRINTLDVSNKEIILHLSNNDKLFKMK